MTSIAVFCGSYTGSDPEYVRSARHVGTHLAQAGYEIIYGGGAVGLMGAVADAALENGGRVIGVMPQALVDGEIGHHMLTEMRVVTDMHERKSVMASLADAFLTLPGGSGTLEEISEQWTWAQLGLHQKPCAFLNVRGFYTPLHDFIKRTVTEGFTRPEYADMLIFEEEIQPLLTRFGSYVAPPKKWNPIAAHKSDQPCTSHQSGLPVAVET
jgi:uncharacterized protein (TIGR00730 family)